jgi:hypothetical protein
MPVTLPSVVVGVEDLLEAAAGVIKTLRHHSSLELVVEVTTTLFLQLLG